MSTSEGPKLDFLKKYKTKKKKSKKKNKEGALKIVVDGETYETQTNINEIEITEDFGDEGPVIAEIIDDRAEYLKAVDDLSHNKWRSIDQPQNEIEDHTKKMLNKFKPVNLKVGQRLSFKHFSDAVEASKCAQILTKSFQQPHESKQESRQSTQDKTINNEQSDQDTDSDLSPEREIVKTPVTVAKKLTHVQLPVDNESKKSNETDLDEIMKDQEREGDPMAKYFRSKKPIVEQQRPKCKYPAAPNRFGIQPGCCWDGVDRSNGFEKTLSSVSSNKKSIAEHAYKWKVEDM